MRKVIAVINMTLDGYCDHTAISPDEEIHDHYTQVLKDADIILYGRITYHLMEDFWPELVKKPSGEKSMDDFAAAIDSIPKVVFSRTLKDGDLKWKTARLAKWDIRQEVLELKQQSGKDISVGSPSLIVELTNLGLIDEYHLCVHPVIVGSGLPLFKQVTDRTTLKLRKTKTFGSGAILLYYASEKE